MHWACTAAGCTGGVHWGVLGFHRRCFSYVEVARGGELGCTGHVPEVMHWFVLGRCTGRALGGLRVPWGLILEVHCRILEVEGVLGNATGCIERVGGALGGGALGVQRGCLVGSTGRLYLGCSGAGARSPFVWPWPWPRSVCVSPHAAAAPPRCARCCHMRVNVRGPVHPSGRIHHPVARGARSDARVSRSPCAATDGGGCLLRPENLGKHRLGASLGLGSASTIPPSSSPPSSSIPAPSVSPWATAGRWWPRALRGPRHVLALRSGSLSPLPAEPVPAALGQELPNPSARSCRFPNQSEAAPALLAFTLSRVLSMQPFT